MSTFRESHSPYTRRKFIYTLSAQFSMSLVAVKALSASGENKPEGSFSSEEQPRKKLGIALVGLGKYSSGQLAPALMQTSHCYLAGIVSGSPGKTAEWKKKYAIPDGNVYNYENFDGIKDNPAIDIVYVVLPNSMHAEYVIRAANAGKHVICEKPMALNTDECGRMISACKEAGKMLSIGYRLHFEPHHQCVMEMMQNRKYGEIKKFSGAHGMSDVEGWRLDRSLAGGGPLMDVGIYCVQAARYSIGAEPIAVTAQEGKKTDAQKFRDIEESLSWQMEFPGGIIADCRTSYSEKMNLLQVDAASGWVKLSPAYGYSGIKGETNAGEIKLPEVNQQARQMDDFAQAIINKRPTPVPGEMGRRDVKILAAIYEAMRTGKRISIS